MAALHTPTAVAPHMINSKASFPENIPPTPIIGFFVTRATSATQRTAKGFRALPEIQPNPFAPPKTG